MTRTSTTPQAYYSCLRCGNGVLCCRNAPTVSGFVLVATGENGVSVWCRGSWAHTRGVTLHLALLTGGVVTQVGDRLLTTSSGATAEPWDPCANKTLVVLGDNFSGILSYAGLAHLSGKSTDERLAEAIWGRPLKEGTRGGLATAFAPRVPLRLGDVLKAVEMVLKRDLLRQLGPARKQGLSVMATGWTWQRRAQFGHGRVRPFATILRHSGKTGTGVKSSSTPRQWRWDRLRYTARIGANLGRHLDDLRKTATEVSGTERDAELALVDQVRKFASTPYGGTVGRDCMAVSIGRNQDLNVCFYRDPLVPGSSAYTPFLIGEEMLVPPAIVRGQALTVQLGRRLVTIDCYPPLELQGRASMTGQSRPDAPKAQSRR